MPYRFYPETNKQELADVVRSHSRVCWYPSGGMDFRPLLFLSKHYRRFSAEHFGEYPREDELPDLFIYTGLCPDGPLSNIHVHSWCVSDFKDKNALVKTGDTLFRDGVKTEMTIRSVRWLKELDLPLHSELIKEDFSKSMLGKACLLKVEISSKIPGTPNRDRWFVDVIYSFAEPAAFAYEYLKRHCLSADYVISLREGAYSCHSTLSYNWNLMLLPSLGTKYFITGYNGDAFAGFGEKPAVLNYRSYFDREDVRHVRRIFKDSTERLPIFRMVYDIDRASPKELRGGYRWGNKGNVYWNRVTVGGTAGTTPFPSRVYLDDAALEEIRRKGYVFRVPGYIVTDNKISDLEKISRGGLVDIGNVHVRISDFFRDTGVIAVDAEGMEYPRFSVYTAVDKQETKADRSKFVRKKKKHSDGSDIIPPPPFGMDDFDPEENLINYNELFKDEQPTLFRDEVICQTLSCLIGRLKPNALLIGAAGVGKTKIAEDIARRIETGDPSIPEQLRGYTVFELPLSNIVSGSGLVGDVERKTRAILEFAQDPENKVILFIDEIHMLVSRNQTYDKIAQLMKPALARGDMRVIGATTLQEAQGLMNDPAFSRRFTRLIVDELTREQTRVVLEGVSESFMKHYGGITDIDDKVLDDVIAVADEYKTIGSHRPDNAITLLDRTMAEACIRSGINGRDQISITMQDLRSTAMKLMTGNSSRKEKDIADIRKAFSVIKGQDEVIEYILETVERDRLNIFPRSRPLTMLFVGSSGVGKSETAKLLARELAETKPIILNMTEFSHHSSYTRIVGSSPGYLGSDSKAELPFDILESNPYQVVILDEFDKSSRAVQRLFMSAFDEGYFNTAKGKPVDLSKSVIIATTNAGRTEKRGLGFSAGSDMSSSVADLSEYFDTELLNRFTRILNFNRINEELFGVILRDIYEREAAAAKANAAGLDFLPDALPDADVPRLIKENYIEAFGARPAERAVREYIEKAVYDNRRAART